MARRFGFLLIATLGLAFILIWCAYWVGLHRLSQHPVPPTATLLIAFS